MERLWSKKTWQLMLVVVATIGTNVLTYTVCVYGSNYYSYQKSLLVTKCEELSKTTKLRSDMFPAPSSLPKCAPCNDSLIIQNVVYMWPESSTPIPAQSYSNTDLKQSFVNSTINGETRKTKLKTIFIITPTYERLTQKIDLTNARVPTQLVTNLLQRCKVKSVHLLTHTSAAYKVKKGWDRGSRPRGVDQRNAGLTWLRKHYNAENCSGVVYFGDDDNKYDLRLFDEIRKTEVVSVFKVAWRGKLMWEGPTCENERATSWVSTFSKGRAFPVDMAGFAIHLCQFIKHPKAKVGVDVNGRLSRIGQLETALLEHFTTRSEVECRGSETEVYAWHSHTCPPAKPRQTATPPKTIET